MPLPYILPGICSIAVQFPLHVVATFQKEEFRDEIMKMRGHIAASDLEEIMDKHDIDRNDAVDYNEVKIIARKVTYMKITKNVLFYWMIAFLFFHALVMNCKNDIVQMVSI